MTALPRPAEYPDVHTPARSDARTAAAHAVLPRGVRRLLPLALALVLAPGAATATPSDATGTAEAASAQGASGEPAVRAGRSWGRDVRWLPGSARWSRAFGNALRDPMVYVLAAGGALFAIDHWDRKVSRWAVRHHPIFGSTRRAKDAGNIMQDVARGEAVLTLALTASGEPFSSEWWGHKGRGFAAEFGAWATPLGATLALKKSVDRRRPDRSDDESFPSGHATEAFSLMTLSNRNLEATGLLPSLRTAVQVGNVALAAGVAWSRVEGRKHFPSDVLVGAALGRFLTAVVHDAYLLPDEDAERLRIDASAGRRGGYLGLTFRY